MVLESKVIVSKSLWKICWRLFGIKLLLASERCVVVGWSLAIGLCYGKWHEVVQGGNIYKCSTNGGGLRGMLRGEC